MKRLTALLLSLTMALSLAACGGETAVGEAASAAASAPAAASEAAPEAKPSAARLAPFDTSATIEETVLLDEQDVLITAMALSYSNRTADLRLSIENNSSRDLSFTSGTLGYSCNSVNGMMLSTGYLNCDVAAGKKAMDTVHFDLDVLQLYGIQSIADMEIGICMSDDDFNSTYFEPRQLLTSLHEGYEYDPLAYQKTISGEAAQNTFRYELPYFAADTLYEQDGVAVLSEALFRKKNGDEAVLVELENQNADTRRLGISNIAVNDMVVRSGRWTSETLSPGKRSVLYLDLSIVLEERYQELFGVDGIGSVSFDVQQFSPEGDELTGPKTVRIDLGRTASVDTAGAELYSGNDAVITGKAVLEPESEYGSFFEVLLLAENRGSDVLQLRVPYDTLSVNGYMVDCFGGLWEVQPGQSALMELELYEDDLEEIGVTEAGQFEQVEFDLELGRRDELLDEATLLFSLTGE